VTASSSAGSPPYRESLYALKLGFPEARVAARVPTVVGCAGKTSRRASCALHSSQGASAT
jgi:hypothetical protein